ncbi:hypothetical protein LIER_19406 [Lithospermum erythrorhizon]|uniref:Integrase catalytic domain-containing protein n=1 Tax=Lithospermum erythrorhizon TaxID=34254 RepID=A0AAV3QJY7_LITER
MYHANLIHQPPEPLHPTKVAWPFDAWGLDMVGPMPWSKEGYLYILVAMDYFSKWAKAKAIMSGRQEEVEDFIKTNIIYRYRVPKYIIIDNGKAFDNRMIKDLCNKFKIRKYHSTMYYP